MFWGQDPVAKKSVLGPLEQASEKGSGEEQDEKPFGMPRNTGRPSQGIFDAKANLSAMLRDVTARVRGEIHRLKTAELGLFDPFYNSEKERGTPDAVREEHIDYFVKLQDRQAAKEEREKLVAKDQMLGYKVVDDIEYCFDRSFSLKSSGKGRKSRRSRKDRPGPGGAVRSSQNGKNTQFERKWLSVLSNSEEEKIRADFAARMHAKRSKFAKSCNEKLEWVKHSRTNQVRRLDKLEHVLRFLEDEQCREIDREMKLFQSFRDKRETNLLEIKIAQERTETADKIMRLLHDYKVISGWEIAHYLKTCNEIFEQQLNVSAKYDHVGEDDSRPNTSSMNKRDSCGMASKSPLAHSPRPSTSASTRHQHRRAAQGRYPPDLREERPMTTAAANISMRRSKRAAARSAIRKGWDRNQAIRALKRRERESERSTSAASSCEQLGLTPSVLRDVAQDLEDLAIHRQPGFQAKNKTAKKKGSKEPTAPQQFGGWGKKMSYLAERILHDRGHLTYSSRPKSFQADCLVGHRVDLMGQDQAYSHLFKRGIQKN